MNSATFAIVYAVSNKGVYRSGTEAWFVFSIVGPMVDAVVTVDSTDD